MLRFFTRRQSFSARRQPARPRLSCERLEDRNCPSGFVSFQETQLGGCLVGLSGVIDDTEPDTDTIQFSGVVSGQTTPAGDGSFSLQVEACGLGDITAEALDADGAAFDTASATVSSDPPSVTVSASYSSNMVVLTGQVSDAQPGGLEVDFSGAVSGTTTTDSSGNFSYTAAVPLSGDVQATTTNVWGQTSDPGTAWASAPPTVTLTASYSGQAVILSGQVSADNPSGLTVNFAGAVSGSAVTAADGSFSLETSVAASGDVTAATVDGNGLTSNTASTWATAPPTVTLSVSYGDQKTITLYGQVSDDDPSGLTVTFSGAASGTAVTDSSGNYSVTMQASSLGVVQATVTDALGIISNPATVTLAVDAPSITSLNNFINSDNVWTFQGTVEAASPSGITVTFNGLPSVANQMVTTQEDGTYVLIVPMQATENGTVTVQATDCWGQTSETEYYTVQQPT